MTASSVRKAPRGRVDVSVDPRIELLSVVLRLSGYGELYPGRLNDSPSPYLRDVEGRFGRYADHEAIAFFRGVNRVVSGDLPVAIVAYLSPPPALAARTPFDGMVRARVENEGVLKSYAGALRRFARDTEFAAFFRAHEDYYRAITGPPEKSIGDDDGVQALEAYFGSRQRSYHVIFAPLLKSVAFGPRVLWENGAVDAFCIFPSVGVENGLIRFKEGRALKNRILHEFGHSFVNPLVDRHQAELAPYAHLRRIISYETGARYGVEWNICVYEHLVRAVTTRLTLREYGPEAGESERQAHEKQGFIFLPDLCDKLFAYERRRPAYSSFGDFFPELIGVFKALSEKAGRGEEILS